MPNKTFIFETLIATEWKLQISEITEYDCLGLTASWSVFAVMLLW